MFFGLYSREEKMKKDKRILALVLAAAMMGTTALPVWAQTPETADSSVVEVEGTLENIIAAREALAAQPATLAEDDNNIQAAQTMVERVANAVKNHTETAEKVNIKDLNLDKNLVLSTLADLNARVEGGEAISKLSCYYSRDTGLAVAIGLEYCTAQDVAAMQVKLDQLVDQANTLCQTDLEKVFYVHEWLVQNIAYDREHLSDDVQDDHNLRGALLEGTAVCDGYAKTYALTLRKLGITGVLVTSKDIGHAWNMVELDGNWYQVDCTWDDPVDGSDQLGYCMHKHLLCTTEGMNTNHNDDGDDSVAFDLENLGTQNIVNLATDDTYENTWWKDKKSAIFPCGGDWYYASGERLFWRDDLGDCDSNLALEDDSGVVAGSIALDGTLLVATDKQACEQSSWIKQYELDPASHEVTEKKKESLQSIGIAAQWDGIYYAVSQQEYHQDGLSENIAHHVRQYGHAVFLNEHHVGGKDGADLADVALGEVAHGHPPQVGAQIHPHVRKYQETRRGLEPVGDVVKEDLKQDADHQGDAVPEAVAGGDGPLVKAGEHQERQHDRRLGQQGFQERKDKGDLDPPLIPAGDRQNPFHQLDHCAAPPL